MLQPGISLVLTCISSSITGYSLTHKVLFDRNRNPGRFGLRYCNEWQVLWEMAWSSSYGNRLHEKSCRVPRVTHPLSIPCFSALLSLLASPHRIPLSFLSFFWISSKVAVWSPTCSAHVSGFCNATYAKVWPSFWYRTGVGVLSACLFLLLSVFTCVWLKKRARFYLQFVETSCEFKVNIPKLNGIVPKFEAFLAKFYICQ